MTRVPRRMTKMPIPGLYGSFPAAQRLVEIVHEIPDETERGYVAHWWGRIFAEYVTDLRTLDSAVPGARKSLYFDWCRDHFLRVVNTFCSRRRDPRSLAKFKEFACCVIGTWCKKAKRGDFSYEDTSCALTP